MGLLDLSFHSNFHCLGILPSICRRSENILKKIRFDDQINQVFTPFHNHPTHLFIGADRLSYLTKVCYHNPRMENIKWKCFQLHKILCLAVSIVISPSGQANEGLLDLIPKNGLHQLGLLTYRHPANVLSYFKTAVDFSGLRTQRSQQFFSVAQ